MKLPGGSDPKEALMSRTDARLLPPEHGAYAMIALPLLGALLSGEVGRSAVALSGAVVAFFLAREPWVVLSGRRGG